mgnify:CR=1 FL=1
MTDGAELLWQPTDEAIAESQLTAFTRWLADETGEAFPDYESLWQLSLIHISSPRDS